MPPLFIDDVYDSARDIRLYPLICLLLTDLG
jgi:hypothetical protein